MTAAAALAFGGLFTSCSHDDIATGNGSIGVVETYERAFIERFGQPAADHTWGFGTIGTTTASTRSQSSPSVANIPAPYDAAWVAAYNETAKEPNSANVWDNYDNSVYHEGTAGTTSYKWDWDVLNAVGYSAWGPVFTRFNWNDYTSASEEIYNYLKNDGKANWIKVESTGGTTGYWEYDENFVRNFKITGTWDGAINVVTTEGLTDGVPNGYERTVVVTGKWNLTETQKVGSKGKIIIANGGELNISSGKMLQLVNQSRLVVLYGGKITGAGNIEFSNGTEKGFENYNGGTIDITGDINNNGGDFYNNGILKANTLSGGAANSCYYNHGVINIDHMGKNSESPNARIYNNCQWYCRNDMRCLIIENCSYFHVGGELMTSGSEDGTGTGAYVALGSGSLLEAGTLYNNGTSWTGPTDGYAVTSFGKVTFLNWSGDSKLTSGYFANNIYVEIKDQSNNLKGHSNEITKKVFWEIVANGKGVGNGNVTEIESKENGEEIIPADGGFSAGSAGCSPGFKGTPDGTTTRTIEGDCMIIAEDLSTSENGDFDFNDVVFAVKFTSDNQATITLLAAGGTLPLFIGSEENEVHEKFGVTVNQMVNTGTDLSISLNPVTFTVSGSYGGEAINIPVKVKKNGSWIELRAERGKVPSKIAVETRYEWCNERQDIEEKYTSFSQWVTNPSTKWY